MGLRGPKPLSDAALAARGGRRRAVKVETPKPEPSPKARLRPIRDMDRILRLLPGYDPFRDATGWHFDEKAARKALTFIEGLKHSKGALAGQPMHLEDWQRSVILNLFGWQRSDGTRRYRQALVYVPRKNGKSCVAAAIITYMLFADGEPFAEIVGAACEHSQASLIHDHVAGFIRQDPVLKEQSKVFYGQAKAVQLLSDYSSYKVLSYSPEARHGLNLHCYIIDELHTLPDSQMLEVLETSTGARRQPLGIYITTADSQREGSPANAMRLRALQVRDGVIVDPSFLPVVYESATDDDWHDENVWRLCNPNLGVSIGLDYMRSACEKAKSTPSFENVFRRLHLNQITEQDQRWLPLEAWDRCQGDDIHESQFEGKECWAGLDLASSRDLTAFVMAFPADADRVALIPRFWIPRDTALAREKADRVPYLTWIQQGWITATEGNVCDYSKVCADILALSKRFNVQELAIDRLFQGDSVGQQLQAEGLNVISHGQGFASMAAPTKRFEELVLGAKIWHGGNPVLRWHASNVSVELDAAGNLKPSRKKSTEKIDGIVAAIMAVGRLAGRERITNVYETRGLLVL